MDLLESTLGLLLGDLGTGSNELGLLSLSLLLVGLLLLLGGLDGLGSLGLSLFWLQGSSLLDQVKGGTDNGSLVLDGLSGSLLGDLLGDTLLVVLSVEHGPGDSSRVLSLLEQGVGLGGLESENLRVASDEEGTSARVDLGA